MAGKTDLAGRPDLRSCFAGSWGPSEEAFDDRKRGVDVLLFQDNRELVEGGHDLDDVDPLHGQGLEDMTVDVGRLRRVLG